MYADWMQDELRQINSMTKYPSIPTYHKIGNKGVLQEEAIEFDGLVEIFEKIDGTNSRVICLPSIDNIHDYVIGSREELLHFGTDKVWNPDMGIVDVLKPLVESKRIDERGQDNLEVMYLEVYGNKIGKAAKNYTKNNNHGAKMFDYAIFTKDQWIDMLGWDIEAYSAWRKEGNTPFVSTKQLQEISKYSEIPTVPHICTCHASELPKSLEETLEWMREKIPHTFAHLEESHTDSVAEGLVIRTPSRNTIAKMRFQDYARSIKNYKKKSVLT